MKRGKYFNITYILNCSVFCAVFAASPLCAHAENISADFTSGKSLASLATLGEAQGTAFRQGISRRQNALHSFSTDIGQSRVFFGDPPRDGKDDTAGKVMEQIGKMLGLGDVMGGGSGPDFWSTKFERHGKVNAAESRDTYEYDLHGFAGGLDMKVSDSWMLGMAGGYSRTSSNFESLYDTATAVDAFHSAVYASYEKDNATLDGMISFTYMANASERGLANTDVAEARSRGYQLSWMMQAMEHYTAKGFTLTPMAGFTFASQVINGLDEKGGGDMNLSTNSTVTHSLRPMLGVDIARTYAIGPNSSITPEIYGTYSYEMMDNQESVDARLNHYNMDFDTHGSTLSRHAMQVGAGLRFNIDEDVSGKFSIDSDMQPGSHDHRATFSLKATW